MEFTCSQRRSVVMTLTHVAPSLSKQGVWGPVTATLDWCEVRIYHDFYGQCNDVWLDQSPVLAIYRRNGKHSFKSIYNCPLVKRIYRHYERGSSKAIFCRVLGKMILLATIPVISLI